MLMEINKHSDAGSFAEYAWVKEEWAAPAPKSLSLEREAGGVPLVFLTAYQVITYAAVLHLLSGLVRAPQ